VVFVAALNLFPAFVDVPVGSRVDLILSAVIEIEAVVREKDLSHASAGASLLLQLSAMLAAPEVEVNRTRRVGVEIESTAERTADGYAHFTPSFLRVRPDAQAAVGGTSKYVSIAVAGMASRVAEPGAEPVRMTTLERLMDDYGFEAVDLLKLDCEGAEWDILPASDHVLPRIRQICMEFHCERGWNGSRLADWLRGRGFTVSHTSGAWNGLLWAVRP